MVLECFRLVNSVVVMVFGSIMKNNGSSLSVVVINVFLFVALVFCVFSKC